MDNLLVMQFGNSSQAIPKDSLRGLHRNLLPDEAQKVVCQVFVYRDTFFMDGVPW